MGDIGNILLSTGLFAGIALPVGILGTITSDAREEYLIQRRQYLNDRAEEPYFLDIWKEEARKIFGRDKSEKWLI